MNDSATPPPLGEDLFRYILTCGFYAPTPEERERWQPLLSDFLVECGAPDDISAIEERIDEEEGTVLEPFRLSPEDRACALYLARVVFSERYARTRFRLVSRDNLSDEGGLVFTSNFRAYYETRAGKDPKSYRSTAWRTVPAAVRVPDTDETLFLAGEIVPDDAGFAIRLRRKDLRGDPSTRTLPKIAENYSLFALTSSLNSAALDLDAQEKGAYLWLRPTGPEAMIRWLGRIQGGTYLRFIRKDGGGFRYAGFHLGLVPPSEKPITLPICGFRRLHDLNWFDGSVSPSRELFGRYRKLVVDRFRIPKKTEELFFSS